MASAPELPGDGFEKRSLLIGQRLARCDWPVTHDRDNSAGGRLDVDGLSIYASGTIACRPDCPPKVTVTRSLIGPRGGFPHPRRWYHLPAMRHSIVEHQLPESRVVAKACRKPRSVEDSGFLRLALLDPIGVRLHTGRLPKFFRHVGSQRSAHRALKSPSHDAGIERRVVELRARRNGRLGFVCVVLVVGLRFIEQKVPVLIKFAPRRVDLFPISSGPHHHADS